MSKTPSHYKGKVTPWCLQRSMETTHNVFIDARRTDAIEYAFRIKDNPAEDWRKAAHCLIEAAEEYEKGRSFASELQSPVELIKNSEAFCGHPDHGLFKVSEGCPKCEDWRKQRERNLNRNDLRAKS